MKTLKSVCDGASCLLCGICMKDWKPSIEANKIMMHFKRGATIFREGDPVTGIYFVNHGTLKVHKHWSAGKELIVRFAKNGDILGHRGLGRDLYYPVTATAMEASTVCFITLEFFWTTVRVNQEFTKKLLLFYAEELQESERTMHNLAHMQVKGRIAYALLLLKDKFGLDDEGALNIELSRQDFAGYTGAAYETAFRAMHELAEEEAIAIVGKRIIIKSIARLARQTGGAG